MLKDYKKIYNLVESILQTNALARNNDRLLVLEVWARFGFELTPEQEKLFLSSKIPAYDSITRARRKIQDGGSGRFLSDKQIEDLRMQEEHDVRTHFTIN